MFRASSFSVIMINPRQANSQLLDLSIRLARPTLLDNVWFFFIGTIGRGMNDGNSRRCRSFAFEAVNYTGQKDTVTSCIFPLSKEIYLFIFSFCLSEFSIFLFRERKWNWVAELWFFLKRIVTTKICNFFYYKFLQFFFIFLFFFFFSFFKRCFIESNRWKEIPCRNLIILSFVYFIFYYLYICYILLLYLLFVYRCSLLVIYFILIMYSSSILAVFAGN